MEHSIKTYVKVLRKSTEAAEDLITQDLFIENAIKKSGWQLQCVGRIAIDNYARFEMREYAKEKWLDPLAITRPDYVFYQDHTRIGFNSETELGRYIEELKDFGSFIVTADDMLIYDPLNDEAWNKVKKKHDNARDEVKTKSLRTQIGIAKAIKKKSSPGSHCDYGHDYVVLDHKKKEKFRIIDQPLKRCEGFHYTKKCDKDFPKPNLARCRTVVYPDGRTEEFNDDWQYSETEDRYIRIINRPPKGAYKIKVINEERAKVVRLIYSLLDGPNYWTFYEVALFLNRSNILSPSGSEWSNISIKTLVSNPIYKGEPIHNRDRTRRPKFPRQFEEPMPFDLTPEEKDSIRIVDVEVWDRVNARIQEQRQMEYEKNGKRTKQEWDNLRLRWRKSHLEHFWAKSFLVCGDCNHYLYLRGAYKSNKHNCYYCQTCGLVDARVIHAMIDKWLDSLSAYQRQFKTHCDKLCAEGQAYLRRPSLAHQLESEMWQYILAHDPEYHANWSQRAKETAESSQYIKSEKELFTMVPPDLDIPSIYQSVFDKVNEPVHSQITALDKELDNLFQLTKSCWQFDKDMLARCDEDRKRIHLEKTRLQSQLISLLPKYKAAQEDDLNAFQKTLHLLNTFPTATGEHKAVLLKDHLDTIAVHFDLTRKKTVPKLCRVIIHPLDPNSEKMVFDEESCWEYLGNYANYKPSPHRFRGRYCKAGSGSAQPQTESA